MRQSLQIPYCWITMHWFEHLQSKIIFRIPSQPLDKNPGKFKSSSESFFFLCCNYLKKVNKKRTVTVRRVIIFLNISRHPLLICLQCCLHQYKTLKAVATATAAIVLLTPAKNLKKFYFGVSRGLPLL